MNEEAIDTINRMRAVTISREYGSGGGEIASRLAKHLGWHLIDHAIVQRVASELGTSQEEAEAHDERSEGVIAQLLHKAEDAQLYDLVLKTSRLDLESAVDLICSTLHEIAKGLATNTDELGSATELSRYPAPLADFRPAARLVPFPFTSCVLSTSHETFL